MVGTARRLFAAFAGATVVLSGLAGLGLAGLGPVGVGPAGAAPTAGIPSLSLNRAYTTAPFAGTATAASGQEGSAFVPADNAVWLADPTKAYEVDATTDALRRVIPTANFTNALPVGGVGAPAGASRSDSFAAVAYDPSADALYVFSRNCCTALGLDPTVFRLLRDGGGAFQVESYQALPAGIDPKGAGYRAGVGLYFGKGAKIRTYDYATNGLGADITIPGIDAAVGGMAFSPDGNDLYLTTFVAAVSPNPASIKLVRINTATWTVVPNWNLDLTSFGVLDPRAVELVGDQIYVSDGGARPAGDPLRRAVFVFDVLDLSVQPTASFSATPVAGQFPLPVQFSDTSQGGPTSWAWDFGDGATSNLTNPTHTYAVAGSYTVTLTVTNSKGTDTSTRTDLVTVQDQLPIAGFTATPTTGQYPLAVDFTDTSVKHPISWAWDFGDGSTSTAQNPSHTYANPGNYAVSLTVTNGTGSNTRVRSDFIHAVAGTTTLTPVADSYVRSDQANANFGTQTTLQAQLNSASYQPFVRFDVGSLPQQPTSATLRLFVTDSGTTTGVLRQTTATWGEAALTWNNKPSTTGPQIGTAAVPTAGSWVELDVSSVVTTAGAYGFVLTNNSSDPVAYSSRQGANPPQLRLTFATAPTTNLPNPPNVGLRLNRAFTTSPFRGTATSARDEEGSAYVPSDNALWLMDDNAGRMYETDATTGDLRRVIPTADFTNALPVGGGAAAGPTRTDDLESLSYDPTTDTLYVASGNCCGVAPFNPTIFELTRDGAGRFQVKDFNALPEGTDPTGSAWRAGPGGGIHFVKGQNITPYDFATNTVGTPIQVLGVDVGLVGATFTPDGQDLLVTSHLNKLYRVDPSTWSVVPGWSFDLTPYGIVDPRAVEVVGDQLFISDGYDSRPVGDPLRYAIFVLDIVDGSDAPVAGFTASPTSGIAPHVTTFTDRSTGVPTVWLWNFGDGTSSVEQNPAHSYRDAGTYSVTLTVTNSKGTATTTQTDLVTVAVNPPLLNAKFTGTPTSGVAPLAVQFTDASVGGVTAWAWDFGDGSTETVQNPTHVYAANGTYTVKLTVTSASGTNTRIRSNYVNVAAAPVTLAAAADSYVRSNATGSNFGTEASVQGQNTGGRNAVVYQPYFRFSVGSLPAAPTSAKVRLFVTNASATSGQLFRTASATWSETGITWNNRPGTTGVSLGASRNAPLGQWVEFDVSSTVTGPGQYSFTLTNSSNDLVAYSSWQGANAPQLVLSFPAPTTSGGLPALATPSLALSRTFTAAPFSNTSVLAHDLEGSAYVPADDALWLSDDNWDRAYEVDATTSILRRTLARSDFSEALPVGGVGEPAGLSRTDDLESIAYDPVGDVLYQFSGNCCGAGPMDPTAFRLLRDIDGNFQVESYQPLPEGTDPTGAGWRPGSGLFFTHGGGVADYDYASNTVGATNLVTGVNGGMAGVTFTPDGTQMIVVTTTDRLQVIDVATWTVMPGLDFDLAPHGVVDPRAVELVDGQLFVSDGDDLRSPEDPLEYAVFVFDLAEAPPSPEFTATPTSGAAPLTVQFTDATIGVATGRIWDFGDGTRSIATNPSHVYTSVGQYTVSLVAANANGSNTVTKPNLIRTTFAPVTTTAVADSYVRSDRSSSNFGTATTMQGYRKGGTTYEPYFRFSVGALPAAPVTAKVRLFVTDSSNVTGSLYRSANTTWTETGITWNTRPGTIGAALSASKNAPLGQWVEFDVTTTATAAGEYSFTLTGAGTNRVAFSSRQGANGPQLVLGF